MYDRNDLVTRPPSFGPPQNETLQDLVLRRLAELGTPGDPMSAREAIRRAEPVAISYETLRSIARGDHSGRLSDRTAAALATVLEVPPRVVYDAARVPMPEGQWQWPERFGRLSAAQRELVEDIAAALLEAYEKGRKAGEQQNQRDQ